MTTKYFKHLFDRTAEALSSVFKDQKYADKVIESYFKHNKKWGKRDRHFFAETIYEIVRWWNQLVYFAHDQKSPDSLDDFHKIIAAYFLKNKKELPEWYYCYEKEIRLRLDKTELPSHLQHAIPEWLYQRGEFELGTSLWNQALNELNTPAQVILRVNTLKTSRAEFIQLCKSAEIPADPKPLEGAPSAVALLQRKNIFATELFQKGLCEVQDGSSQMVADFLAPKPGERVIDACAGAGGKSLHLAALMENKGKIISLDIHEWKLKELQKRARRAGVHCIETREISSSKIIKRLKHAADAVLMDVPCSGLGVLKRNPDTKWKLTPKALDELHKTQTEIINSYCEMVKPGGRFVYSTCSLLPSENSGIVSTFLKNHPEWRLIQEKSILPSSKGFDGFYMAHLQHQKSSST